MSANLEKVRKDMHTQFNHLLSRAARLRERLEKARKSDRHTPLQLLRGRNLLLRIERRIVDLMSHQRAGLRPALATVSASRRLHA